jgi:hypothetical protein
LYIIKPQVKCTLARDEIQGRHAQSQAHGKQIQRQILDICRIVKPQLVFHPLAGDDGF